MTLNWLARALHNRFALRDPNPAIVIGDEPPPEPADHRFRERLDRAAIDAQKMEILGMLRDNGPVIVVGGRCCHTIRALYELSRDGLIVEGSDEDGHIKIALTLQGLEVR